MNQGDVVYSGSFKPINLYSSSDESFDVEPISPTGVIFREVNETEGLPSSSFLTVRRANPVKDLSTSIHSVAEGDFPSSSSQSALAPYPLPPCPEEAMQEAEASTNLSWTIQQDEYGPEARVDFSRYFEMNASMDDCDDFSLSSQEANSMSDENFDFGAIEDPTAFWEQGVPPGSPRERGTLSPAQVSLESNELCQ